MTLNSEGYKIKQYLELYPVSIVKPVTITFMLLCLSLRLLVLNYLNHLGITEKISSPINLLLLVSGFLIFFFGIFILIGIQRHLKLYILFFGVAFLYCSLLCLVTYYELLYYVIGKTSFLFILFAVIGLITVNTLNFYIIKRALKRGNFRKGVVNNKVSWFGGIGLSVSPYLFGKGISGISKTVFDERGQIYFLAFVTLLLCFIFILGAHYIYKYYLIKKYEDYVDKCILPNT